MIAAFLNNQFLGFGASGVERPDVAQHLGAPSAQNAGFCFDFRIPAAAAANVQPRLFVLSSDGGASELHYRR
jgi:hypothetical protein